MPESNRRLRWVHAYARLKPGVTREQAKASLQPFFHGILEMEVQQKEFAQTAPDTKKSFLTMWIEVLPAAKGESNLRSQFASPLLVLTALVGLALYFLLVNRRVAAL